MPRQDYMYTDSAKARTSPPPTNRYMELVGDFLRHVAFESMCMYVISHWLYEQRQHASPPVRTSRFPSVERKETTLERNKRYCQCRIVSESLYVIELSGCETVSVFHTTSGKQRFEPCQGNCHHNRPPNQPSMSTNEQRMLV